MVNKKPLPPDYVRPTLAEFIAAGFVRGMYEEYFTKHENEVRKHYVPPVAALPAVEPEALADDLHIDWCDSAPPPETADDNPNQEADNEVS